MERERAHTFKTSGSGSGSGSESKIHKLPQSSLADFLLLHSSDLVISREAIQRAVSQAYAAAGLDQNISSTTSPASLFSSIIVRTLSPQVYSNLGPGTGGASESTTSSDVHQEFLRLHSKTSQATNETQSDLRFADFSGRNPPYFTASAVEFLVSEFPEMCV